MDFCSCAHTCFSKGPSAGFPFYWDNKRPLTVVVASMAPLIILFDSFYQASPTWVYKGNRRSGREQFSGKTDPNPLGPLIRFATRQSKPKPRKLLNLDNCIDQDFKKNRHSLYFSAFFSSIKTNVYNTTVDSHLYLGMASASDSGTYACNVADLAVAHLSLHILNGKSVIFWGSVSRTLTYNRTDRPMKFMAEGHQLVLNYWPLERPAANGLTFEFRLMTFATTLERLHWQQIQFSSLFFCQSSLGGRAARSKAAGIPGQSSCTTKHVRKKKSISAFVNDLL